MQCCWRRLTPTQCIVAIRCSLTMHDRAQPQQASQPSADPHRQPGQHHHQQPAHHDANSRRHPRNNRPATATSASAPPASDHHRRRRDVTSAGINGTGSPALLLGSPNSSTSSLNSDVDRQVAPSVAPDPLSISPLVRYVNVVYR